MQQNRKHCDIPWEEQKNILKHIFREQNEQKWESVKSCFLRNTCKTIKKNTGGQLRPQHWPKCYLRHQYHHRRHLKK